MSICTSCGQEKPLSDFGFIDHTKTKRRSTCRNCASALGYKYRKKIKRNPKDLKDARLRMYYCLTLQEYERIFNSVEGKCEICSKEFSLEAVNVNSALCVDHVEGTYLIRGLLCTLCNTGIGALKHDVNLLMKAVEYCKRKPELTQSQINVMSGIE